MGTQFKVGEGNRVLAQISDAAAELLAEAHEMRDFGIELGGVWYLELARELESEGFGSVMPECLTHGIAEFTACGSCDTGEIAYVFMINDAGREWLEDAGRI